MKLQQLKYLAKTVECAMSVSRAARELHTSQSGVSRYLSMLEQELGVDIFVREDRRLVRLTPGGQAILEVAKRMLSDADELKRIGEILQRGEYGELCIATAHTHARHVLPKVLKKFFQRFPKSGLKLRLGYLPQAVKQTVDGEADFFVGTVLSEPVPELTLLPAYELHRVIVVPARHELLKIRNPSLEDVAKYPLITNDQEFTARAYVIGAFELRNLVPNVVLSTTDTDIMKAYVRSGMGVGIMAHFAYDKNTDKDLRAINVDHLFGPNTVYLGYRKNAFLTPQMRYIVELLTPGK